MLRRARQHPHHRQLHVVNNDGRGSEYSVVVDIGGNGGTGNSAGTTIRGNFGFNDINGSASTVKDRSVHTLHIFP